jgi:FAD/FMN-containing dehydrogenase
VRSGGHDYAGYSTCNGGLVIDLARMNRISLNQELGTAIVKMGADVGRLYDELWRYGFTAAAGTCATVGMGGLSLGGGIGPLVCKYGLTCDNIVSAKVVLADGSTLRTSASEQPDLFWAIRGGGGNFGIVTETCRAWLSAYATESRSIAMWTAPSVCRALPRLAFRPR